MAMLKGSDGWGRGRAISVAELEVQGREVCRRTECLFSFCIGEAQIAEGGLQLSYKEELTWF